jgi:uncharacterized membrane protein (GlpM family)
MIGIGEMVSTFPGAIIRFGDFSFVHIPTYYLLIAVMFFIKNLSMYQRLVAATIVLLVFSALAIMGDLFHMF